MCPTVTLPGPGFFFPKSFHVNIRFARLQIFITVCQVKLQTAMQKMILQMIYLREVRVVVALKDSRSKVHMNILMNIGLMMMTFTSLKEPFKLLAIPLRILTKIFQRSLKILAIPLRILTKIFQRSLKILAIPLRILTKIFQRSV